MNPKHLTTSCVKTEVDAEAASGSSLTLLGQGAPGPHLLPQQSERRCDSASQVLAVPIKLQSKFPLLDPAVFTYEFFW